MQGIKRFKVDTTEFSLCGKRILEKLILAAELIAPLYLKQKNNRYPGANFYPKDASKEEILKTAKKNRAILNPYTFVERDKSGRLKAVPFHLKFKEELKPIAKLLIEAAGLSSNKNFSQYLKLRAKSLLNGSYEESEIFWLETEQFKFGFVIGPIERYIDKLFFRKCAYQAWVGILDKKQSRDAEQLKEIFLASRRKILPRSEKVDVSKLGVRVDKTLLFSGLIADFMFTGTNLPNDVKLMGKHGSNLTIFGTSLESKFRESHYPIFQKVFAKSLQKKYTREELYTASLRCILLHEISHSLIRYRDAEERLKEFFPVFDELLGYVLGVKGCGTLLLKGAMTQKELEAILIMHICRNFTWWLDSLKNPDVKHYATGAAIAQNFFFKEKGVKEQGGISWPDFTKLFICVDELTHLLEYHLALGSYQEAKKFVEEYGSFKIFEKFSPKLKNMKKV